MFWSRPGVARKIQDKNKKLFFPSLPPRYLFELSQAFMYFAPFFFLCPLLFGDEESIFGEYSKSLQRTFVNVFTFAELLNMDIWAGR